MVSFMDTTHVLINFGLSRLHSMVQKSSAYRVVTCTKSSATSCESNIVWIFIQKIKKYTNEY